MSENGDNSNSPNELETKIVNQIEYYFSDINLSRDKFMKEMIAKEDGWIPMQTLLTFNRLKSLSEDKSVVINALKKSVSKLLEISEDEDKIRRSLDKPLPTFDETYTQELNERTLHIKGFPEETKLDDVMNFCKEFGAVENIEMRRFFKTKKFKGCIFVTFENKEVAQKVMDSDELKYGDKILMKENKISYFARKKEFAEKKNFKTKPKETPKKEEEQKEKDEKEKNGEKKSEEKVANSVKLEAALLKLKGVDENTKFPEIKDLLMKYGNVSFVEETIQNETIVRFAEKEGAKNALEKIKEELGGDSSEVKLQIGGKDVVLEVLTGDEEQKYWEEYEKNRLESNKRRKDFKHKKGRNMWQRGGKRGYQGKGRRNDNKRFKKDDSD